MKHIIFAALLISAITCKSNIQQAGSNTNTASTKNASASEKINNTATIAGNWQLMPVFSSDTAAGKIPSLNLI